jgi:hypothetical protein
LLEFAIFSFCGAGLGKNWKTPVTGPGQAGFRAHSKLRGTRKIATTGAALPDIYHSDEFAIATPVAMSYTSSVKPGRLDARKRKA